MATKSKDRIINLDFTRFLDRRKIFSIYLRVLPNISYDKSVFSKLISQKDLVAYFKGIRKINEYPGMYDLFKKYGFTLSLADKIRLESSTVPDVFKKNISNVVSNFVRPNKRGAFDFISQAHLDYLCYRISELIPNGLVFVCPTELDLIEAVNKKASSGLPNPRLKKREFIPLLSDLYKEFSSNRLSITQIYTYPAAAFMRLQVRASGLKVRVVNAVSVVHQFFESFYYLYFMSGLKPVIMSSSICIGLTQYEVSQKVSQYTKYTTYSIDYNGWDINRPQILSIISFEILQAYLPLTPYMARIIVGLRNIYLTVPLFHPTVAYEKRNRGTVSGSGFTSLDNSICNWVLVTICMYEYCTLKRINPFNFDFKVSVAGDDLLLGVSGSGFDFELFQTIISTKFGMTTRLEAEIAPPGVNTAFFLGSNWIDGRPFRPEALLVASVIFGTGDFPYMTRDELFQSRFFEVFGNSADAGKYWKRFKIPIRSRRFIFNELVNPFRFRAIDRIELSEMNGLKSDRRGFWIVQPLDPHRLDWLWSTR